MLNQNEIEKRLKLLKESKEEDFQEVKEGQMVDQWWDHPKVGETLQGIYLETRQFNRKSDGKAFNSIILATDNAKKPVYGVSENIILEKRLHKPANCEPIQEGDGLKLTYLGKKQSKKSTVNRYHDYRVEILYLGERKPQENVQEGPEMMSREDVEAAKIVEMIEDEISAKRTGNVKPTLEEIVDMAVKYADDPECEEVDSEMLTRIKVFLANKEE